MLIEVDDQTAAAALDVPSGLPAIERCSDPAALLAESNLPHAKDKAAVQEGRAQIARAIALQRMGRHQAALDLVQKTGQEAQTLGFEPLIVEAKAWEASTQGKLGHLDRAVELAQDAYFGAGKLADDTLAASIAIELAEFHSHTAKFETAHQWLGHAAMMFARTKEKVVDDRARLALVTAQVLDKQHRQSEALPHIEQARELYGSNGNKTGTATVLNSHAIIVGNMGRSRQSVELHKQALELRRELLDPAHPSLGNTYNNLGSGCSNLALTSRRRPSLSKH